MKKEVTESSKNDIKLHLTISPEYSALVPPLSKWDYEILKQSIKEHGQDNPIVINEKGVILDGHNRFRICQELGIQPRTEVRSFKNKSEEKDFVVRTNLDRRQMSEFEKAEIGYRYYEPLEKQRAKNRIKTGKVVKGERGKTNEIVASRVGLSSTTYMRARTIIERGSEELQSAVREKELSISEGYKRVQDPTNWFAYLCHDYAKIQMKLADMAKDFPANMEDDAVLSAHLEKSRKWLEKTFSQIGRYSPDQTIERQTRIDLQYRRLAHRGVVYPKSHYVYYDEISKFWDWAEDPKNNELSNNDVKLLNSEDTLLLVKFYAQDVFLASPDSIKTADMLKLKVERDEKERTAFFNRIPKDLTGEDITASTKACLYNIGRMYEDYLDLNPGQQLREMIMLLKPMADLKWTKSPLGWLKVELDNLRYGKCAAGSVHATTTISGHERKLTREQIGDKFDEVMEMACKLVGIPYLPSDIEEQERILERAIAKAESIEEVKVISRWHERYVEPRVAQRKVDLHDTLSDKA